jgi:uncharacterized protein involved in copper resistance
LTWIKQRAERSKTPCVRNSSERRPKVARKKPTYIEKENIMKSLKQILAAGLIATAGLAALSSPVLAAESEPAQRGFVHGPDYAMYQMDQYHSEIEHMSQEDRSKLMAMQDKLMQMQMDHASAKIKMEMESAKAQRDIQMFIYSAHKDRGQAGN